LHYHNGNFYNNWNRTLPLAIVITNIPLYHSVYIADSHHVDAAPALGTKNYPYSLACFFIVRNSKIYTFWCGSGSAYENDAVPAPQHWSYGTLEDCSMTTNRRTHEIWNSHLDGKIANNITTLNKCNQEIYPLWNTDCGNKFRK
jgi:hypothetical protein